MPPPKPRAEAITLSRLASHERNLRDAIGKFRGGGPWQIREVEEVQRMPLKHEFDEPTAKMITEKLNSIAGYLEGPTIRKAIEGKVEAILPQIQERNSDEWAALGSRRNDIIEEAEKILKEKVRYSLINEHISQKLTENPEELGKILDNAIKNLEEGVPTEIAADSLLRAIQASPSDENLRTVMSLLDRESNPNINLFHSQEEQEEQRQLAQQERERTPQGREEQIRGQMERAGFTQEQIERVMRQSQEGGLTPEELMQYIRNVVGSESARTDEKFNSLQQELFPVTRWVGGQMSKEQRGEMIMEGKNKLHVSFLRRILDFITGKDRVEDLNKMFGTYNMTRKDWLEFIKSEA